MAQMWVVDRCAVRPIDGQGQVTRVQMLLVFNESGLGVAEWRLCSVWCLCVCVLAVADDGTSLTPKTRSRGWARLKASNGKAVTLGPELHASASVWG